MSDKKKTKQEIIKAISKWLDTPAKNTGVGCYGESEGMPAEQEELNELNNIINDIIECRFCNDYSGFSYIKQYPLVDKREFVNFHLPMVPDCRYILNLDDWNSDEVDRSIESLMGHIESVSKVVSQWMRLKGILRREKPQVDKSDDG